MTLLHAATLQSCDSLYNFTDFTINSKEIHEKLQKLSLKYPENYINFLGLMLEMKEFQRPDFIGLNKEFDIFQSGFSQKQSRETNQTNHTNERIITKKMEVFLTINLKKT